MSRDSSRSPESSAALRRLLSSHHSIYNTLTDPLLECTSPSPPPHLCLEDGCSKNSSKQSPQETDNQSSEILSPALEDSLASFSSWQALNLSSFQDIAKSMRISSPFSYHASRPASASILSNSTDEDLPLDSLVIVPSSKKQISPQVLLFETDEEDDAEDDISSAEGKRDINNSELDYDRPNITSSNSQRRSSVRTDSSQTFIMPKMSLFDENSSFQITILSSEEKTVQNEIQYLIGFVQQNNSSNLRLAISHITLGKSPQPDEIFLAQKSNVLLAINDGCVWIPVLIGTFSENVVQESHLPAFMVVNVLSSNYFANLFEIIRNLRPSQSLKSSSLKSQELLNKIKAFIDEEIKKAKANTNSQSTSAFDESSSTYRSLGDSIEKPDYRNIERTIRHEMVHAPEYRAVDPLQLSSSLSHLSVLVNSLSGFFVGDMCEGKLSNLSPANREALWFACSFSVGIGLGFTLNAFHVFKMLRRILFLDVSTPTEIISNEDTKRLFLVTLSDKFSKIADETMARFDEVSTGVIQFFSKFGSLSEVSLDNILQECRAIGDLAVYSAINGFIKVKSIISGWIE